VTKPMTPHDADLRGYPAMLLDVQRLRDSDIANESTGDEFRAAVLLWCASWHQLPAGSLPDSDRALCRLAGYGRDMDGWLQVRDGALRGWVLCDDGRLYHPVIAEKVMRWTLHEDGSFDEQHLTQFIGGCGQWSFSNGDFVLLGSIYNNHHKMTGTLSYWDQGWIFREHDGRIFEMVRYE